MCLNSRTLVVYSTISSTPAAVVAARTFLVNAGTTVLVDAATYATTNAACSFVGLRGVVSHF